MKKSFIAVVAALLLVGAGCSGSTSVSTNTSATSQPSSPPAQEPSSGTVSAGVNVAVGLQTAVSMSGYAFQPAAMTVKAGTTVTWMNQGPSPHHTTSDTMMWDSPDLAAPGSGDPYGGGMPAGSFQFIFSTAGTYHYHCSTHPPAQYPGFTGTIVVN